MCLAIPGKITDIPTEEGNPFRVAKVSFGGIQKNVDLSLVPDACVGDYVLVHVGVAISIVDEKEANKTFEYLKQLGELEELSPPDT